MTWTYGGDPSANARDQVRFLIGDTDTGDQLLQDGEVNYCLGAEPNPMLAGARACEAISAKFARKVDRAVGDLKLQASQRSKQYRERAEELRRQGGLFFATPYAGGISISDKEATEADTDRVKPFFFRGMEDNDLVLQPGSSTERDG